MVSARREWLLLFFNAAPRLGIEAIDVTHLVDGTLPQVEKEERFPFTLTHDEADDSSVAEFKTFFRALHRAWLLDVPLLLDV